MKDRTILAIKGLAIIGVAYHHVNNRRLDVDALAWSHMIVVVLHWCVLGFFLISGYLQAMSDSRKSRSLLEFTRGRVRRLLVPFVVLVFFYSCLWQLVQAAHIPGIGMHIPPTFLGKLASGLWPVDSQVAEQLYFFLLLFGISMVVVVVQKALGFYGLWAATVIAGAAGMLYYSGSFTGFVWGTFVWGIAFYAGAYLMFHYREQKPALRVALVLVTILFISADWINGTIRCIPLWLLAEGALLRLDRVPLLVRLGDASGTIYVYHTPFLIAPLVILATYLHGNIAQFIGINVAVAVAIGLCYLLFESLKNTPAKKILM